MHTTPGEMADAIRQRAHQLLQERERSFERSDTDGFLSQWASGVEAQRLEIEAQIVEERGLFEFPALFDLEGRRVRAKLIPSKYGQCWAFCDWDDRPTGRFVGAFPANPRTLEKKGFRQGREWAPARAEIVGSGHGLSGTAVAAAVRTDRGYPDDAIV